MHSNSTKNPFPKIHPDVSALPLLSQRIWPHSIQYDLLTLFLPHPVLSFQYQFNPINPHCVPPTHPHHTHKKMQFSSFSLHIFLLTWEICSYATIYMHSRWWFLQLDIAKLFRLGIKTIKVTTIRVSDGETICPLWETNIMDIRQDTCLVSTMPMGMYSAGLVIFCEMCITGTANCAAQCSPYIKKKLSCKGCKI